MKKSAICLFVISMFSISNLMAQDIAINGYIFCDDSVEVEAVPFATVKYYSYKDPGKLEYIDFTDLSGKYDIGQNVKQKEFHIEISAPGYQKRGKNIGNLPKTFKGNMTLHFRMHKSQEPLDTPISIDINEMKGVKTLTDAILQVPVVEKIEGNDVVSIDGGTIRVFINGFTFSADKLDMLSQFPIEALKDVHYYNLLKYNTMYDGVINLILTDGEMAGAPDFTPAETTYYDISE